MLVKGPLSPAISTLQLCRMHHFVTRYLLGIWLLAGLGTRCTRSLVPRPTALPARAVLQLLLCWQSSVVGVSLWEREPPLSSPARGGSGTTSQALFAMPQARSGLLSPLPVCRSEAGAGREVQGRCLVERQSEEHVAEEGTEPRRFNPCSPKAASL